MLALTGQKELCYRQATNCREIAVHPTTSHEARQVHLDMELRWLDLARTYELAELVSGYLQFAAQRHDGSVDLMSQPAVPLFRR